MTEFSLQEILKIIDGEILSPGIANADQISSISIDSRTVVEPASTLFVALAGERHDGHNYLTELYKKGVRSFIVSDKKLKIEEFFGAQVIYVPETLKALQQIATWIRQKHTYPVLAITGSNGKTIVKEWLFELLQPKKIVRSPKSFNSQVGVPLSVFNMDCHFDLAIFEAGISKPGEMQKLASILSPSLGIFTNIGDAHQENFQTLEQKVEEKLKLFENCELLVYCCDDELVEKKVRDKFSNSSTELVGWSFKDKNSKYYIERKGEPGKITFTLTSEDRSLDVPIPFSDEASVENAAHCLVFIAEKFELNDQVLSAFETLQPVAMRLELKDGINNCSLINDYYNSDIHSLGIALQFLNQQTTSALKKKTIILSDIKQTGVSQSKLVKEVSRLVQLNQVDRFIGIGEGFYTNQNSFGENSAFYKNTDEFLAKFKGSDFQDESILIKGARDFHFERISSILQKKFHQTTLEIRLHEMIENLNSFKALLKPETKVMVMVKAFSYGSGTVEVAQMLQYQKVDYLAVAVADEGIDLRKAGISVPIVVMNPEAHSFESLVEFKLEPNIYSSELFERFERFARKMAIHNYPVHLKVDSGMHRLGFSDAKEFQTVLKSISSQNVLRLKSIFSHLAASDEEFHDEFTNEQYQRFEKMAALADEIISYKIDKHLLNSAGIERFPEYRHDMVRLGIGLYGVSVALKVKCRPIAYWKTSVSQVVKVSKGETIGYGRMGKVDNDKEIAVIPVGYADGYDRRFGNGNAYVWVKGKKVPTIGNICMDMSMIDVTGLNIKPGDSVELMGEHIKLMELANCAQTIPYEILTGISQRVKRIYVQE